MGQRGRAAVYNIVMRAEVGMSRALARQVEAQLAKKPKKTRRRK